MVDKIVIAKTPSNLSKPSPSFDKNEFEVAIFQKGYNVIHEQALKCPCKSRNTNQQSNCQNCGGTGFSFINPVATRMILHSMNMFTKYKEWSEENLGKVNISARDSEQITFMDRITVVDGNAIYTEVKHFKKTNNVLFAYTAYNIKEILYIARFVSENQPYQRLTRNTDYTFVEGENKIIFDDKFLQSGQIEQDLSITIRYKHSPQFYVIDVNREVMNSFIEDGGIEKNIVLPVSAIGRRAHYILDAENLAKTRIINNSFVDCDDVTVDKTCQI